MTVGGEVKTNDIRNTHWICVSRMHITEDEKWVFNRSTSNLRIWDEHEHVYNITTMLPW